MATERQLLLDRLAFQAAQSVLRDVAAQIRSFDTHHTGKVLRDVHGDAVGRGRGIMPGLTRDYPSLSVWEGKPSKLAAAIEAGKGQKYVQVLDGVLHDIESQPSLVRFARSAPLAELRKLPAIAYPPHRGSAKCLSCGHTHGRGSHRFHGRGAFDRTHGITRRRAERPDLGEEVPDWVTNPRRGGVLVGILREIRYKRTVGKHPGFYKHAFKTGAKLYRFGSSLISVPVRRPESGAKISGRPVRIGFLEEIRYLSKLGVLVKRSARALAGVWCYPDGSVRLIPARTQ